MPTCRRQSAIPPFLSLNTVWCSNVLVLRTHVTMRRHTDDTPMMEMGDVMLSSSDDGRHEIMVINSAAQIRDVGG